jgi:hypothetical protein
MDDDFTLPTGNYEVDACRITLLKDKFSVLSLAVEHLHNYVFLMLLFDVVKKVMLAESIKNHLIIPGGLCFL